VVVAHLLVDPEVLVDEVDVHDEALVYQVDHARQSEVDAGNLDPHADHDLYNYEYRELDTEYLISKLACLRKLAARREPLEYVDLVGLHFHPLLLC
jgi:hypothetical protein